MKVCGFALRADVRRRPIGFSALTFCGRLLHARSNRIGPVLDLRAKRVSSSPAWLTAVRSAFTLNWLLFRALSDDCSWYTVEHVLSCLSASRFIARARRNASLLFATRDNWRGQDNGCVSAPTMALLLMSHQRLCVAPGDCRALRARATSRYT